MDTETARGFGDTFRDVSNIHPLAIIIVLILGMACLTVPRKWAGLTFIILGCFVSSAQKVVILSLDFNLLRVMILFGVCRILLRQENRYFKWKKLDWAIIAWALSSCFFGTWLEGSMSSLVNRLGLTFEALGMYFVFRCWIRDFSDLHCLLVGCVIVSIPVVMAFLVEHSTQRNLFALFGGVREITMIRDGKLRCQGAFAHAILAGCFWVSFLPLFAAMWWRDTRGKLWASIGIVNTMIIIYACASSTPVFGFLGAVIGGLLFFLRKRMRLVRWLVLGLLAVLQLVMNSPIWSLVARASAITGGTGWHRYYLVDQFIKRYPEWFLKGTRSTSHWGWGLKDVTNHYILQGVRGGFATLALFITILGYAYRSVGLLWRRHQNNRYHMILSWALGVSLFVHCMNFIGVSYFGQIYLAWYMLLGIIGSLGPDKKIKIQAAYKLHRSKCLNSMPTVAGFYPAAGKVYP